MERTHLLKKGCSIQERVRLFEWESALTAFGHRWPRAANTLCFVAGVSPYSQRWSSLAQQAVACAAVTRRPRVQSPSCAERLVDIYFSPFNIANCVSVVARMTTYMGSQVGQVFSLLGLGTVVQPLWPSDHCHQDMSVGLMVPTWQRGFSPGTPLSSSNQGTWSSLLQLKPWPNIKIINTTKCKAPWTLDMSAMCNMWTAQRLVHQILVLYKLLYTIIYIFNYINDISKLCKTAN